MCQHLGWHHISEKTARDQPIFLGLNSTLKGGAIDWLLARHSPAKTLLKAPTVNMPQIY